VKKGDTLSSIAEAEKTTLPALRAANPGITDPNMIVVVRLPDAQKALGLNMHLRIRLGGHDSFDFQSEIEHSTGT